MKYIIATLIGNHKTYSIPKFFQRLNELIEQPELLLISTTEEVYKLCPETTNMRHIQGEDDTGNDTIKSTTSARESIRQHSLNYMEMNPDVEWVLWLDNDIGVPPNLIERFRLYLEKKPNLVMVNSHHPARQDGEELRHGMACTFTHRDALSAYPFTRASLRGANYGDDQIWLSVIGTLGRFTWRNNLESSGGVFFDVTHFVEDGREKNLPPHLRSNLL